MKRLFFCLVGIVVGFADGATWAATAVRGFPVRVEGTADVAAPLAIDIDADGKLEIVLATRTRLTVLEADGSPVAGFPVELARGSGVATGLAAGLLQLGSQPRPERPTILFGTADGALAAIESTGQARPGFPVQIQSKLAGAPSLADLDGDGRLEILFGTEDGRLFALGGDGKPRPGFPANVGAAVSTSVTLGRFDPKGDRLLIFGDDKGRLHAWVRPGVQAQGFPYNARYSIVSQPVLGDVDDDGRFEVVFGSKDYKIHVVEPDGQPSEGFPVTTGYRIYSACALADVSGDGVVDVVATSGDGKLYAIGRGGQSLPGFPVAIGGRLRSSPVVADLDLDGQAEIAVGSDRNQLVLVRSNGKVYPGFPARLPDRVEVAPLMVDLTGNGLFEILVLSRDGSAAAFRMLKKGGGRHRGAWPAEGRDAARSAVVAPNPPRYLELVVSPVAPRTSDALRLAYRFFDMDGDPEPASRIRWYRDGKPVAELDGQREVPAAATRKHQRWHFTVQASAEDREFASQPVEIRNTQPASPRIRLRPEPVRTLDEVQMEVVEQVPDADGDKVQYRIGWLKDRAPLKGMNQAKVAAKHTAKGERFTVVVTPFDGEEDGLPARESTRIANSAPLAPRIKLVPERPSVSQPVRIQIDAPGSDPDGDPIRHLASWQIDGVELNLPEDDLLMPAGMAPKHAKIRVQVTSFDGQEPGASVQAQAEVVNTPPGAPQVQIEPAAPDTTKALRAVLLGPAEDPDQDPIQYRFSWSRKGKPYNGPHAGAMVLPATEIAKGERWTVMVVPHDQETDGKVASAEVVVANSPPEPPEAEQVEPRPRTDQELGVRVSKPPRDPDGDPCWTDVQWSLDGKVVESGRDLFRLPAAKTRKHGRYLARLVPHDGQAAGRPVELWFEVQNSPPGACKLAIEPARPVSGQTLSARLVEAPSDPDGDRVELRYGWYRDGEPLPPGKRPEQLDGGRIARGQRIRLVAVPFDGEAAGPACEASVQVQNQPPPDPLLELRPAAPTGLDSLELVVSGAERDPDGDPIQVTLDWTLDGAPAPPGAGGKNLPAGRLRKGQLWRVRAVASDGDLSSQPVEAQVRVANSRPAEPKVEIRPREPLSSDDLRCRLTAATRDPDGDRLEHLYTWYPRTGKGAEPAAGEPVRQGPVLPAAHTRKGQTWVCRVQASDGELTGPASQAEALVKNAAPSQPGVEIEPARPTQDQPLRCVVRTAAVDPDGDTVRYRFWWFKDGVLQKYAPETDHVPVRLTRVNDIWQCRSAAFDGQLEGQAGESQEVLVVVPGL